MNSFLAITTKSEVKEHVRQDKAQQISLHFTEEDRVANAACRLLNPAGSEVLIAGKVSDNSQPGR